MGVAGKHEGVAVSTGAVEVQEATGVLHSIGVIVRVDDPVVIVCKPESQSQCLSLSGLGCQGSPLPSLRSQELPETGFILLGSRKPQRMWTAFTGKKRKGFVLTEKVA